MNGWQLIGEWVCDGSCLSNLIGFLGFCCVNVGSKNTWTFDDFRYTLDEYTQVGPPNIPK